MYLEKPYDSCVIILESNFFSFGNGLMKSILGKGLFFRKHLKD